MQVEKPFEYDYQNLSQEYDCEHSFNQEDIQSESAHNSHSMVSQPNLYVVMDQAQLKSYISNLINEVQNEYGVSEGIAIKLLIKNDWSLQKIQESITDEFLLNYPEQIMKHSNSSRQFECFFCNKIELMKDACSLGCEHYFCSRCFQGYLISAINEKELFRGCYGHGCPEFITLSLYEQHLATNPEYEIFEDQILSEMRNMMPFIMKCKRDNCRNLIKFTKMTKEDGTPIDVKCDCGHSFCSQCGNNLHAPANCHQYIEWMNLIVEKANVDHDLGDLMAKNCPACESQIIKNPGQKHAFCKICEFEFCWNCLADWKLGCFDDCEDVLEEMLTENKIFKSYRDAYLKYEEVLNLSVKNQKKILKNFKELNKKVLHPQNDDFLREAIDLAQDGRRIIMFGIVAEYFSKPQREYNGFNNNPHQSATVQAVEILENILNGIVNPHQMNDSLIDTIEDEIEFGLKFEELRLKLVEITKCVRATI